MQGSGHASWHTITAQCVALEHRKGTYAMTTETLACNDCATNRKGNLAFAETTTGTRPVVRLIAICAAP